MSQWYPPVNFSELEGKILYKIKKVDNDELLFKTKDENGKSVVYKMYHYQDCCETVYIDDIVGDLNDLLNSPIIRAEERSEEGKEGSYGDTSTWTFYEISTIKGSVTIRWYGTSNGYYSERADFVKVKG